MGRLARSWRIFQKAEALLSSRKALAAFPAVSFCVLCAVLLPLAASAFFLLDISFVNGKIVCANCRDRQEMDLVMACGAFLAYLLIMFTTNFCSAAFYSEIFRCLKGEEEASIARGFRSATDRILPLFLWSLLSATVGVILRLLSGRRRSLLSKALWFAWSVASCFAIPVLVLDTSLVNPFRALKRSGTAINRTWGEALIGFAGLKILLWTGAIGWGLLMAFLWAGYNIHPALWLFFLLSAAGGTLLFGIFSYLVGAAETIYRATLFLYAEEGIYSGGFDSEDLNGAFLRE